MGRLRMVCFWPVGNPPSHGRLPTSQMTNQAYLTARVEGAYRECADLRERTNGDGTFTIDGAQMMALIELRNLAPEIVLALDADQGP